MIPNNWTSSKIGDRILLQRGFDITKVNQNEGEVPVISSGGIASFHDAFMSLGPGVILGRKGVVGSVFYIDKNYWPHDTTLWVKSFGVEFPRFIYYFFLNMVDTLKRLDVGSANPTLNRNHVHSLDALWPPLHEQRAIAHVLGSLDDKIELNREMNRTLEDLARTVFKAWFVDFEGQTAFEEVEGRRVPQGWRVGRLGEIARINPAYQLKKGVEASYLEMKHVPTAGPAAEFWVSRPFGSGTKFKNGDTLLARITPCLENGKTCLVDFLSGDSVGWGSTEFIVMSPYESQNSLWVYMLARDETFRGYAIQKMTGSSGRQRVPNDVIADYLLPIPNTAQFARFESFAAPLFAKIHANNEQSRTLRELRDALLPRLISGELRVRDAERFL